MKQGWEIKKLGEVCKFWSGYTPKSSELKEDGDIPYFKVSDMNHELNVKYLTQTSLFLGRGCKTFSEHSIVFPKNGAAIATNKKRILKQNSVVDLNTGGVIADETMINHEFLYLYLLNTDFKQYTRGGAVPTLDIVGLKNRNIPVPPLPEQEKIVSELDCLSGIIEKKRQQLKELDALAQSIFYEMFGNPVDNERGWEVKAWDQVFETRTGKLNANAMVENGKYPFFTCSKDIYRIDDYVFDCEALLLAGNNATANYDVKYYKGKFNAYQRTYILTLKNNGLYSFFKFSLENKLSLLQEQSIGVMTKYLTMGILNKISFLVPPLPLQQSFAQKIEAIEQQKALIKQSIAEVETLFNARMQEYFE